MKSSSPTRLKQGPRFSQTSAIVFCIAYLSIAYIVVLDAASLSSSSGGNQPVFLSTVPLGSSDTSVGAPTASVAANEVPKYNVAAKFEPRAAGSPQCLDASVRLVRSDSPVHSTPSLPGCTSFQIIPPSSYNYEVEASGFAPLSLQAQSLSEKESAPTKTLHWFDAILAKVYKHGNGPPTLPPPFSTNENQKVLEDSTSILPTTSASGVRYNFTKLNLFYDRLLKDLLRDLQAYYKVTEQGPNLPFAAQSFFDSLTGEGMENSTVATMFRLEYAQRWFGRLQKGEQKIDPSVFGLAPKEEKLRKEEDPLMFLDKQDFEWPHVDCALSRECNNGFPCQAVARHCCEEVVTMCRITSPDKQIECYYRDFIGANVCAYRCSRFDVALNKSIEVPCAVEKTPELAALILQRNSEDDDSNADGKSELEVAKSTGPYELPVFWPYLIFVLFLLGGLVVVGRPKSWICWSSQRKEESRLVEVVA